MSDLTKRHLLVFTALLGLGFAQAGDGLAAPADKANSDKANSGKAGSSKARSGERATFIAAEAETAQPEGLSGPLRIAGDDPAAFQTLIDGAACAGDPWLVLSGGGENGAYAAGLLAGWSKAGDRPAFGVITGVSTGALIAPFAFVGASADATLRRNYTETSAADVFEFGASAEALTDTWPLKARIEATVTPALLQAVAAEHAKGRRLLVATTLVDAERPVLWDMGAIAATGGSKALSLFRAVMMASAAVPGAFPPVLIRARAGAKDFQEMHADGGAMGPFYLAPAAALAGEGPVRLPARTVYVVVNNRLTPEFRLATRTTLSVLGRTMSAAIKAQTAAALALTRGFAERTDLDLRVAQIDGRFTRTSEMPFDQAYMRALFAHGEALGADGSAFAPTRPSTQARPSASGDLAARR